MRLVVTEPGSVCLRPSDAPDPAAGEVRVATTVSLMSTGTENTVFTGDFGSPTHWEYFATMPHEPGYLTVGVVDAVGAGVAPLRPGDRVFHRAGHGSRFTLPAAEVCPVPDGVTDDEAVWAGLAKIAYRAAVAAPFALGGRVVIVGAGPVGQMAVRWAAAAGCEVVAVVARSAGRLEHATRGGATHAIALPVVEAAGAVREALGGAEPELVVDATGNAEVLGQLLVLAGPYARILLLGDPGHPGDQRLNSYLMLKGLTVQAVHDTHFRHGGREPDVLRYLFGLMARGRFDCSGLISHRFAPEDAAQAYKLANEQRGDTMGIAFDWS